MSSSTLSRAAGAILLAGFTAGCATPGEEAERPPNILLVVADDHGQWAASPYGNPEVLTPSLDRLAESGIRMANATSPSPVCSPARASLLTGRIPSQHGIHDFLAEEPEFERGWLDDELLLPELLQRAGFHTTLVGKWHCSADSAIPALGFDRWISYDVRPAGWRNQYLHHGLVHLSVDGRPVTVDGHQTEQLTRMAIASIEERPAGTPFFLLFAPTETHAPFEGQPERWLARYREAGFEAVPRSERSHLPAAGEHAVMPEDPRPMLTRYHAAVSFQDEQLGLILDALEASGELDRTLVVYTSDHGHMNGHHGLVGKANATLPQNLYEETVRVPMLLRWPGQLPAGAVHAEPFDHCDLFITLLDAAGVELGETERRAVDSPGRSLFELTRGSSGGWRRHRFSEHGNARMVADERFKLVRRYPPLDPAFGDELYDLAADPREAVNLIEDPRHADLRTRLEQVLEQHYERYGVPARSGLRVMDLGPFNGREPWRRLAARGKTGP